MIDLPELSVILTVSIVTALLAVWCSMRAPILKRTIQVPAAEPMALLFENAELHHATSSALSHLALSPGQHGWDDLRDVMLPQFPDFPTSPGTGKNGRITLVSTDCEARSRVEMRWRDSLCWVTVDSDQEPEPVAKSQSETAALAALRRESDTSPNPSWQEDAHGKIIWHNKAYAVLSELAESRGVSSADPLFEPDDDHRGNRACLRSGAEGKPDWFELSTVQIDDTSIHHATCINSVIDSEDAKRNFVQTLTKTFAHLSIGLAIFDRKGQLALFNPALVDMTNLPAPFLSGRPTMLSFFDQLRENRRMPEPKNYRTWRQEISEMITAASDGRYQETWSLETGQTYKVVGRPHPDGATAFLIEDKSAEVALTRNFRAELELGQSLLDTIDDGLAVFAASGILTFCNRSYRQMWGHSPDTGFADVTIADSIGIWKSQTAPNPMWHDVRDFVSELGNRQAWDIPICRKDGTGMTCQLRPVRSGATLIRFTRSDNTANLARTAPANAAE